MNADARNPDDTIDILDIPLHIRHQVLSRTNVTRFQRACKCAAQSPRNGGNKVVEGRRVLLLNLDTILGLVEIEEAPVHTVVHRLLESLELRSTVRALVLVDSRPAGMDNLSH